MNIECEPSNVLLPTDSSIASLPALSGDSQKAAKVKFHKISMKCEPKSSELFIKCAVCSDRASGFHYGVHACEGCKGFFRRTIRMKLKYPECTYNCAVTVRSRNKCKFCRFKKCIELGMSHDAIRFGRMSRKVKMQIIAKISKERWDSYDMNRRAEEIQKVINDVATAFQKKMSATRTKLHVIWNLRNLNNSMFPLIDKEEDVLSMLLPHDSETDFGGLALYGDSEMYENFSSSCQEDVDSLTTGMDGHTNSNTSRSKPNSHSCGNRFYLRDKELFELLECIKTDIPPATADMLKKHNEEQMNSARELLKDFEEVEVTTSNIESMFECIPSMKIISDYSGISHIDIKQYAILNNFSIGKSFLNLVKKVRMRVGMSLYKDLPPSREIRERFDRNPGEIFGSSSSSSCKSDYTNKIMRNMFQRLQKRIVITVTELTEFAKCIPGFRGLSLDDQITLLKFGSFEALFVLLSCAIFEKGLLVRESNIYITFNFLSKLAYWNKMISPKIEFAEKLAGLKLSDEVLSLYISTIILFSDRPGLQNPEKVEELQSDIICALEALVKMRHATKPYLFATLLVRLADLRELAEGHVLVTERMANEHSMNDIFHPLVFELCNEL